MSNVVKSKRKLATLAELQKDPELAFKNDELNLWLSQSPAPSWIKYHPKISVKNEQGQSVPLAYLPIDKVKYLLTYIFQEWDSEILSVQQVFQSVVVSVRLHYMNPATGKMRFKDGVGAVGVQTDKGETASNLAAIKYDAVMKAAPAAESYAIKNAAEKIGNIFGAGLNKWDVAVFNPAYLVDDEKVVPPPPPSGFTAPKTSDFEL
jgi:hypothetical protein